MDRVTAVAVVCFSHGGIWISLSCSSGVGEQGFRRPSSSSTSRCLPLFSSLNTLLLSPLLCLFLSVSVLMGAGTIRKAQNLLKQYSQHGLDGKKGSNLTPLEGKARCLSGFLPSFSLTFAVFLNCCSCVSENNSRRKQKLMGPRWFL